MKRLLCWLMGGHQWDRVYFTVLGGIYLAEWLRCERCGNVRRRLSKVHDA